LGWYRTARLPSSRLEAGQLASKAHEPMPVLPALLTGTKGRALLVRYSRWLERVTDAATRASAWYLTDLLGAQPFLEQTRQRKPLPDEPPLPNLGPSTAAYVIVGETSEIESGPLENALATPRSGVSAEQFIATLAKVGFMFADIATPSRGRAARNTPDHISTPRERTNPVVRVLLRKCRLASTALRTWTLASRRCEEWLGANWKSEIKLKSLDELLPLADRVPLPRLGFAPEVLPGRR